MELENYKNLEIKNNKNEITNNPIFKTINNGIDIGLRYLLPDLIEDEILSLKNNMINYGIKDGIKNTLESVQDIGKQSINLLTGNFESVEQIQDIIKKGGVVDKISDVLDTVINKLEKEGKIEHKIGIAIKQGKNSILNSVEKNIDSTINKQKDSINYVNKYINNWEKFYNKKDFEGMEKEYKKIKKELKEIMPIKNIIEKAEYIENLHTLIKNKGQDFNISQEELELVKKLNT